MAVLVGRHCISIIVSIDTQCTLLTLLTLLTGYSTVMASILCFYSTSLDYKTRDIQLQHILHPLIDNSPVLHLAAVNQSPTYSLTTALFSTFKMRFNAVIAATILAATVSGAAIANPQPTEVAEAAPIETEAAVEGTTETVTKEPEFGDFYYITDEDEEALSKRDAEAGVWQWSPKFRPIGMPIGKRDAEASVWQWSPKFRPIGMPIGKRDADADAKAGVWQWSPKFRPIGMPIGKRDAEAEAEAQWQWSPYRPIGMPIGKRDAKAEAEAQWQWSPYRPIGMPIGKREAQPEAEAEAEASVWQWSPKFRPIGMPIGKRDAEAEAEAQWQWSPYRPIGMPIGK